MCGHQTQQLTCDSRKGSSMSIWINMSFPLAGQSISGPAESPARRDPSLFKARRLRALFYCFASLSVMAGETAEGAARPSEWQQRLASEATRLIPGTLSSRPPEATDDEIARQMKSFLEEALPSSLENGTLSVPSLSLSSDGGEVWKMSFTAAGGGPVYDMSAKRRTADFKPLSVLITGLSQVPDADFKAAHTLATSLILGGKTKNIEFQGVRIPYTAGRMLLTTQGKREVSVPWDACWVFFCDDAPSANWAHPCRYIFVASDLSAVAVQYASMPLTIRSAATLAALTTSNDIEVLIPFVPPCRTGSASQTTTASEEAQIRYDGSVSNCYAVIISGGYNSANNNICYWGDVAFVYSTLTLKYKYPKANIFALISDGLDPEADQNDDSNSPADLDGDGEPDIDDAATVTSVSNVLTYLQTVLTPNDQLFVFSTDHGSPTEGGGEKDAELNLWDQQVFRDTDLKGLTTNFPCTVIFVMGQCFGGGFLDDLNQSNRMISTAAYFNKSSYSGDTAPYYDQWCYHWTAAMRGYYPTTNEPWADSVPCFADANNDGYVSFREADRYAYAHKYAFALPMYQENPPDLGKRLFLVQPAADLLGIDKYEFDAIAATQTTNTPFSVRITARNVMGNTVTDGPKPALLKGVSGIIDPRWCVGHQSVESIFPLNTYYHDSRTQIIYPSTLFGGAKTLTNLAINVVSLPGQTMNNWTIRMKHTALDAYPDTPEWESEGWTVVYQTNETITATGWNTFPFSNAFDYNGTDNLMIDFSFDNDSFTFPGNSLCSTSSAIRSIIYESDSEDGAPLDWSGTSPEPIAQPGFVNLRFGSPAFSVYTEIDPTHLADFADGKWTGNVKVLTPATNMWLRAVGTNDNWTGTSTAFAVTDYLFTLKPASFAQNGAYTLRWQSGAGATYRIMMSTNLLTGFTPMATGILSTPPLNVYTGTLDPVPPCCFFRVQEE